MLQLVEGAVGAFGFPRKAQAEAGFSFSVSFFLKKMEEEGFGYPCF